MTATDCSIETAQSSVTICWWRRSSRHAWLILWVDITSQTVSL